MPSTYISSRPWFRSVSVVASLATLDLVRDFVRDSWLIVFTSWLPVIVHAGPQAWENLLSNTHFIFSLKVTGADGGGGDADARVSRDPRLL